LAEKFLLPKKAARIVVLQRIELASLFVKKLRKLFGRYIFSNFITKLFLDTEDIASKYYKTMSNEFLSIKKYINKNDNLLLSIGGGIGGLEVIINKNFKNKTFYFIERNYISKKVKYGWGNDEAYNNFELQKSFLKINDMNEKDFYLVDFDNDKLPLIKFDIITSLFSLDYHYDFHLYIEYLKKVSKPNTKIIFDTIRAEYFEKLFKNVEIINLNVDTVHRSKRIVCSNFIN
tara:strand:+ start:1104 stop:1799 length:696 start_codon:yes stop_codon:yes gene_type:complete